MDTFDHETLRINPDWAKLPLFDRKGWKRVRFGDVVRLLKEQVDPSSGEVDRYVAGEHMESENVHIRRWGNVGDGYLGPAFIRRFRKGQVLYGSRRTYLKKVAVAEWDGVTANTTLVLEAIEGKLLQRLLPWLMLSERFTRHSVQESKGSTNPYINWPDIAKFEFDLPPLDQQRRIAEILCAVDETLATWKHAHGRYVETLYAFASRATFRGMRNEPTQATAIGELPASWRCVRIEDVTENSAYGPRFPSSSYATDGNAWQLRTTDFDRAGGIDFSGVPSAQIDDGIVSLHLMKSGDFLLSRSGEYAGLTAVFSDPQNGRRYIPGAFLIRYRFTEQLASEYLLTLCNTEFGERFVKPLATGSAQPNISGSAFSRLLIPLPPIEEQGVIVRAISEFKHSGEYLARHVEQARALLSAVVSTIN